VLAATTGITNPIIISKATGYGCLLHVKCCARYSVLLVVDSSTSIAGAILIFQGNQRDSITFPELPTGTQIPAFQSPFFERALRESC
jgi:hypothetical protein